MWRGEDGQRARDSSKPNLKVELQIGSTRTGHEKERRTSQQWHGSKSDSALELPGRKGRGSARDGQGNSRGRLGESAVNPFVLHPYL